MDTKLTIGAAHAAAGAGASAKAASGAVPRSEDVARPKASGAVRADVLAEAVQEINDYLRADQRAIRFSIDDATGRTVVKITDSETNEVIRQIPSQVVLDLARTLQKGGELSDGVILRDRA